MKHGDLVNTLLLAVSPLGLAWSNPTGALRADNRFIRYGLVGSSDIILVLAPLGRMIGIEAKVGDDAWRKRQRDFATSLTMAGGIYILARSRDGTGADAVSYTLDIIHGL